MEQKHLRVNRDRLRHSLEEMAGIGATPGGGVHRLALSEEDRQARDLLVRWLEEIDCQVTVDRMGNIFGKRPGCGEGAAPVLSGSHLDSQPRGGRFDGVLGVMATLECLRTLHEQGVETERSMVLVNWTNEEGTRFAPAMVGSGVWAGALDLDWAYDRTDLAGRKQGEELERIGYRGRAPCRKFPVHAYYEYHIEQGPVLERKGKTIGVPQGIVAVQWHDVYVQGEANHAGTTPMEERHDALCAAAEMILRVSQVPAGLGGNLVVTVGEIQNHPNSRNVIPGQARFTIDLRTWEEELGLRTWESLKADFRGIAARRGVSARLEEIWRCPRAPFTERLVRRVIDTAQGLGYSNHTMVSGAGHDASYLNQVCPTAMIFVPSQGGQSHVEAERTSWQDCTAGANVLLHCLLRSAAEI